jgi:hypothetical protein
VTTWVVRCVHDRCSAVVAHLAGRRSRGCDPAAVFVPPILSIRGRNGGDETHRRVVSDRYASWVVSVEDRGKQDGEKQFEDPDIRAVAEAVRLLERVGLLMRALRTHQGGDMSVFSCFYVGLARFGWHALQTNTGSARTLQRSEPLHKIAGGAYRRRSWPFRAGSLLRHAKGRASTLTRREANHSSSR